MKSLLKLSLMTLIIMGLLFTVGCESDDDAEDHVLVGDWALGQFEQAVVITSNDSVSFTHPLYGLMTVVFPGDTLVDTTVVLTGYATATVNLLNDFTFTLAGVLPVTTTESDTLGYSVVELQEVTDAGTWVAGDNLVSLSIEGDLFTLGGALTVDNVDAPTAITMAYSESVTWDGVLPIESVGFFPVSFTTSETTTLGWAK
ncbi:MAG: hypothetical protein HQ509_00675 [Candidatus Marinimicrobia bacterium]|nr:hypothetical protein [Candidatus Neomarinimicrobiota bacterium]